MLAFAAVHAGNILAVAAGYVKSFREASDLQQVKIRVGHVGLT
jgi:hypothetical protein